MAALAKSELLKRDNLEKIANMIFDGAAFDLIAGKTAIATKKIKTIVDNKQTIIHARTAKDKQILLSTITLIVQNKKDTFEIELKHTETNAIKFYRLSDLVKSKEFGGVASKSSGLGSERQELGLIDAINDACRLGRTIIPAISNSIPVIAAVKQQGLSALKQEPYIDINIKLANGSSVGISCKGSSAPSLAGGGGIGLDSISPKLMIDVYTALEKYLSTELKLKHGDKVLASVIPDIGIQIPENLIEKIIVGTKEMGGPVDYMYIGPMNVQSSKSGSELKLNGEFYSANEYIQKLGGKLFFRIRKRDIASSNMIQIEYQKKNKSGYPLMFVQPNSQKTNLRIVVADKTAPTWKILTI